MGRLVDLEKLMTEVCTLCKRAYPEEPCEASDCLFAQAVAKAPTFTKPNEPLTLEELQEMDGQPVWVEELNRWALVDLMYSRGDELIMVLFDDGDINVRNVKLCNLHCYRRPAEGEEEI